jgi:hypothetical protein
MPQSPCPHLTSVISPCHRKLDFYSSANQVARARARAKAKLSQGLLTVVTLRLQRNNTRGPRMPMHCDDYVSGGQKDEGRAPSP